MLRKQAGFLSQEDVVTFKSCSHDRVAYQLEKGVFPMGRNATFNAIHFADHGIESIDALLDFITKRQWVVLGIRHRRQASVVGLFAEFNGVPSHEFGLALHTQAVIIAHHCGDGFTVSGAKFAGSPAFQVLGMGRRTDRLNVPGHIQEEFRQVLTGLDIAYISDPQLAGIVIPGLTHFRIDLSRGCGGQPEVIMRPPPIGKVVIDTGTPGTFLFVGVAQSGQIPVIVVTPDQGGIVGYLHTQIIDFQYLLIGNKGLRHFGGIGIDILGQ